MNSSTLRRDQKDVGGDNVSEEGEPRRPHHHLRVISEYKISVPEDVRSKKRLYPTGVQQQQGDWALAGLRVLLDERDDLKRQQALGQQDQLGMGSRLGFFGQFEGLVPR